MTELLTAAQMRAIETAAIESGEVTGLELMERAGRGVVEAVFEEWPELAETSRRAVVLCGPGNNGGDGFVVARLLKEWGWEVDVFLYGDPGKLPPDANTNYERWREIGEVRQCGFPILERGDVSRLDELTFGAKGVDLAVDALFGTGLSRPADGLAAWFDQYEYSIANGPTRWVSVDIPSGLCADSGRLMRAPVELMTNYPVAQAELVVTFHRPKLGHFLASGALWCEKVVVKDIGLEKWDERIWDADHIGQEEEDLGGGARLACNWLPFVEKSDRQHKYSHGHALVLSGGPGTTGAARLAARGALRIGAGLVTLGVPPAAEQEVASQITALMLRRVEDGQGLSDLLQDQRLNALCLGPGLGIDRARDLVPAALAATSGGLHPPYRSVVLDADALTAFQDAPEDLFEILHERCVLTPHAGEFARLFPDIAAKLGEAPTRGPAYSKVDAAREAAKRAGCVVLFKGPDTVIAQPDGLCSVNSAQYERAAPWLATAGSGDVLAGFITGLLARGLGPMQAAESAAWLHVECARSFGPGLIAEDLPEELPKVFRGLGEF